MHKFARDANAKARGKTKQQARQRAKAAATLETGRRVELKECLWCVKMFRGFAIQRYCCNACKCRAYRYRRETGEAWQN